MRSLIIACLLMFALPSFAQVTAWKAKTDLNYAYSYDFNTRTKKGAVIAKECSFIVDITADGKGTFGFLDRDFGDDFSYQITSVLSNGNDASKCIKLLCSIKDHVSLIYIYLDYSQGERQIDRIGIANVDNNEGVLFYYSQ